MSDVHVLFLGTGDAFGSGGRLQTAALLTTSDVRVLVDCGPSTLAALRRERIDPGSIDVILLTHLHGDHFGGIPFLLMDACYVLKRTRPLVIAGPCGTRARVTDALELLFPGSRHLPLAFSVQWDEWTDGERISWPGVAATPVGVAHSTQTPCYGLRIECGSRVLAFSGDTEWTDALVGLSRDADLFVCECYGYDSAPPKHLDYRTLMAHAASFTCRRLLLTHMGDAMLGRIPSLPTETTADGLSLVI